MEWLPFALFAYLLLSCCNLLSKILISQYIGSITVNLVIVGVWNLLPMLLVPAKGLIVPNFGLLALALTSGLLYIYILVPYFKALSIEEASRVIPLWRFTPLFILLFSSGLTGETLDFIQLAAFLLLVVGGLLVSMKNMLDLLHPSKAFYLMMISSCLSAIYSSIAKLIYLQLPYYDGFTLMRLGVGISALALLAVPKNRTLVVQTLRRTSPAIKGLIVLNGLLEFSGIAFYNFAMSLAPVSLVSASAGMQAIFVLLFSMALSMKFPQLLHEDMSQGALTQKGVAIALIVIGTGMIGIHH